MLLKIIRQLKTAVKSSIRRDGKPPYWVVIGTKQPYCIYYFGPFDSSTEARQMQHGYIEDLVQEKATGIDVKIKQCLPTTLTITEEESLA